MLVGFNFTPRQVQFRVIYMTDDCLYKEVVERHAILVTNTWDCGELVYDLKEYAKKHWEHEGMSVIDIQIMEMGFSTEVLLNPSLIPGMQ